MKELQLKAKHSISIPIHGSWYHVNKDDCLNGTLFNDIVTLILEGGTDNEAIAFFTIKNIETNFNIT